MRAFAHRSQKTYAEGQIKARASLTEGPLRTAGSVQGYTLQLKADQDWAAIPLDTKQHSPSWGRNIKEERDPIPGTL